MNKDLKPEEEPDRHLQSLKPPPPPIPEGYMDALTERISARLNKSDSDHVIFISRAPRKWRWAAASLAVAASLVLIFVPRDEKMKAANKSAIHPSDPILPAETTTRALEEAIDTWLAEPDGDFLAAITEKDEATDKSDEMLTVDDLQSFFDDEMFQ